MRRGERVKRISSADCVPWPKKLNTQMQERRSSPDCGAVSRVAG